MCPCVIHLLSREHFDGNYDRRMSETARELNSSFFLSRAVSLSLLLCKEKERERKEEERDDDEKMTR